MSNFIPTYRWLNPASQLMLDRDYLLPGQTLDQRVSIMADAAEKILAWPGFAARFKANVQRGWYSIASPIWTNFGTDRGFPISCFGSNISDSMFSILETHREIGTMTQHGGGTSAWMGDIRSRGMPIRGKGTTCGSVHFAQLFDTLVNVVSQGSVRRGEWAGYWPIDHGDIREVLTIRKEGSPLQKISYGVCVSDAWMKTMIDGDKECREIWAEVIKARIETGYPYILFSDTVNRNTVDVYRDKKMMIKHSNLCSEILLPDTDEESFVCDLSSMNVRYFDEWEDTDAVELLVAFLDAVMSEFIVKAKKEPAMVKAVRFAERHRALGVGWLGWHGYLQSKMVPWESMEAKRLNAKVAKTIQTRAWKGSAELARRYGEPDVLKGYGRRNTTLTAIAPTKSSSFILGQESASIEPVASCYYISDTQKIKHTVKNVHLEALLETKGLNTDETWMAILKDRGSVRRISGLAQDEKDVFKTFAEISPMECVVQAAQRQSWVDQGQSLNLLIPMGTPVKDINKLIITAWELGVKTLYYNKSVNAAQEFTRNILDCVSCES